MGKEEGGGIEVWGRRRGRDRGMGRRRGRDRDQHSPCQVANQGPPKT